MNYKVVALGSTAILSLVSLAWLRYTRRKQGWTVLEKVLLGVGAGAVLATVIVATRDYEAAKKAIEAMGNAATDQKIVERLDIRSLPTLGDLAKEFNLSHQKAAHLIKKLDLQHAGEVIRTGYDKGLHLCKVYSPDVSKLIRQTLARA